MANDYSTKGITGKSTRKQVPHKSTSLQAALVDPVELAKVASVLNDPTKSGKQEGAVFITKAANGNLNFAIAEDLDPADKWHTLVIGTEITPA